MSTTSHVGDISPGHPDEVVTWLKSVGSHQVNTVRDWSIVTCKPQLCAGEVAFVSNFRRIPPRNVGSIYAHEHVADMLNGYQIEQ